MEPGIPKLTDAERAQLVQRLRAEFDERSALGQRLLEAIQARLAELEALLAEVSSPWHAEDGFYRFYHQSLKVYGLQGDTARIVQALQALRMMLELAVKYGRELESAPQMLPSGWATVLYLFDLR